MNVAQADQVLAEVRRSTIASLDVAWGSPSLADLSRVIDQYDQVICNVLVECVHQHHGVLWPHSNLAEAENTLTFADTVFEVATGHDIWDPAVLHLAFIPRATSRRDGRPFGIDVPVSDCGRYSRVRVYPPVLDFAFEFQMFLLQDIIVTVLETGHAWVAQKLLRLVSRAALALSRDLYQLLWQLSPRVDRRRVWFLMVSEGRAFYLVEEVISLASIELFSAFTLGTKNPMDLYVEFVTASLPFEVIWSKHADEVGKPLDVRLTKSEYKSTNTALVEAEMSIFGDESLTIMPLHLDDAARLFALYPTDMAATLSPTLVAHRQEFADVVLAKGQVIVHIRESISSGARTSIVGKVGEFFGGFVKGITE